IAAPQEHWSTVHRSLIVESLVERGLRVRNLAIPDESPAKGKDATVPAGIACHEFQRKAGALGESADKESVARDAGIDRCVTGRTHGLDRCAQPRFVLAEGREKRIRIPRISGSSRGEVGDAIDRQNAGQPKNVARGRASAMDEHDGGLRLVQWRADSLKWIAMQIHQPLGMRIWGSCCSMRARWTSSHGGSCSFRPSASGASSTAKPGSSVAISKSTP